MTERDLEGVIERVDALVRQRMDEIGTPGLVLALTDRDGLLHAAAYGHANADSRKPMTTGHLLETGSIGTFLPVFHTLPRVVVEVAEVI